METWTTDNEPDVLKDSVAEKRNYGILNTEAAREVARLWLAQNDLSDAVTFGLPEIDDRYHLWRVPLVGADSGERVGEVVVHAYTSLLLEDKSTSLATIEARLLHRTSAQKKEVLDKKTYKPSNLRNTVALARQSLLTTIWRRK